ncbi:MAG: hypothetical protein HYY29_03615 [Chloroflexi bacterium]|nr:hypothetical protein [Chloroflexota bacterium]
MLYLIWRLDETIKGLKCQLAEAIAAQEKAERELGEIKETAPGISKMIRDYKAERDTAITEAAELRRVVERIRNHWPPGPVRPFDVSITLTAHENWQIQNTLASSTLAADHLAQDEALRTVLQFYADEKHYLPVCDHDATTGLALPVVFSVVQQDGGKRAREALGEKDA